jgi:hypothetical protein
MKRKLLPLILVIIILFSACISGGRSNSAPIQTIISPYRDVNWDTFGQYKAALHVHSTNSDGSLSLSAVIENHYIQGFDILAVTDHNNNYPRTINYITDPNGLTQVRFNQITSGEGRNGRRMILVPNSSEQRAENPDEFNAFFYPVSHNSYEGAQFHFKLPSLENTNGIGFINHPGRSTGGRNSDLTAGAAASNNINNINKYVSLFLQYPSLVGMEIFNRQDNESRSDRILWDNILRITIPQNRYVWGFANDDSHRLDEIGINWNVFVMSDNTLDLFQDAMKKGNFYMVARAARRELGDTPLLREGPVPVIKNIVVNQNDLTITITAENSTAIKWIYDNKEIYQGETITLNNRSNRIGSYIRAIILGPGGITLTQPFGLVRH